MVQPHRQILKKGKDTNFWTATELDATYVWDRHLGYNRAEVGRDGIFRDNGFSVRCVKD